jgi:cephalosporin-C deacetylase
MPLIDMPLEKLQEYRGRNPRPDDFDEYWATAEAELEAIPPDVSLREVDLGVRFARGYDMFFTGLDSARVYAKLIVPTQPNPKPGPGLVAFHGYTGDSGDWSQYLHWAAQGFTVGALDCRGQAGKSQDVGGVQGNTQSGHIIRGLVDSPQKLLYRAIFMDTVRLARIVMDRPEVDAARVAATGGSQGGALTVACAALEPRIARLAPVFPFLADYQRVWEMDLAERAYREVRDYFRRFDPLHESEAEVFRRLGYIDIQHLASRIRGDVLFFTGLMDDVCPPSTQFAVFNKIASKKEMVIYPDFGHEGLPRSSDRIVRFLADL